MSIIITIEQKGARVDGIESLIERHVKAKYPDASIRVERHAPPESRSNRFDEAQSMIDDAKSEAESLRDELPENLQGGSKADELQSAIDELESFISNCEDAENISVDFPGMY